MCCASTSSSSPPTRDPSRSSGYSVQSSIRTGRRKVPPAVLTQAKTPLLVYRFFADLNVRVFERTAILSNFVGPIWILPLAILILNPLPCLSEILERRPPCIGGQVTSIGVIDRAVCVSAPTAEYLNEANRHDHKGNYRKCSHLTGMLVVLSAVRKKEKAAPVHRSSSSDHPVTTVRSKNTHRTVGSCSRKDHGAALLPGPPRARRGEIYTTRPSFRPIQHLCEKERNRLFCSCICE